MEINVCSSSLCCDLQKSELWVTFHPSPSSSTQYFSLPISSPFLTLPQLLSFFLSYCQLCCKISLAQTFFLSSNLILRKSIYMTLLQLAAAATFCFCSLNLQSVELSTLCFLNEQTYTLPTATPMCSVSRRLHLCVFVCVRVCVSNMKYFGYDSPNLLWSSVIQVSHGDFQLDSHSPFSHLIKQQTGFVLAAKDNNSLISHCEFKSQH